jgi:hypothetical protein
MFHFNCLKIFLSPPLSLVAIIVSGKNYLWFGLEIAALESSAQILAYLNKMLFIDYYNSEISFFYSDYSLECIQIGEDPVNPCYGLGCPRKWLFEIPRNTEFYAEVTSIPRKFIGPNSAEFRGIPWIFVYEIPPIYFAEII